MKARELKEIFKVIDNGIWRLGEFLDSEEIHHFSWKRKLAHIRKCTKDLLEEIERF